MSKTAFNANLTKCYFRASFSNGKWNRVGLINNTEITLPINASGIHYGQSCFEGLKAHRDRHEEINIFRPDKNFARMEKSAEHLMMPTVPKDIFFTGIEEIVRQCRDQVPLFEENGSFYLRPIIFGSGSCSALKPTDSYEFLVFGFPMTDQFYEKDFNIIINPYFDRAAPRGVGHIKAAGNYASAMRAHEWAVKQGYTDCLYTDSHRHLFIEELGAANIIALEKGKIIAPQQPGTVLPGIVQESAIELGQQILGDTSYPWHKISVDRLLGVAECAACGTAAGLRSIDSITVPAKRVGKRQYPETTIKYETKEFFLKLGKTLSDIQRGITIYNGGSWLHKVT